MKKTILLFTVLSTAILFSACKSQDSMTAEERLKNIYGWNGGVLPKPAPNPVPPVEVTVTQTETDVVSADGKNAGIVSTVEVSETVIPGNVKAEGKDSLKADKPVSKEVPVKAPADVNVPQPPASSNGELSGETKTHVVKQGESLWTIAVLEYKNGHRWNLIFEANKALLKEKPNSIRPGMKLVIPQLKPVPVKAAEPVKTEAPVKVAEPVKTEAPVKAAEPVKTEAPRAVQALNDASIK